jgi:hypothetical protein
VAKCRVAIIDPLCQPSLQAIAELYIETIREL